MTAKAKQWIVGVDSSPDSLHALNWAVSQAGGHDDVAMRAMFAIEPAFYGFASPAGGQLPMPTTEMENLAAVNLEARVDEIAAPLGISVESSIAIGPPAAVMLDAGKDAELMVVGSRGRGGFASLMLGSVSLQLANHADVPTVVVPADAPARRATRLVVGVDGSSNSRRALEWACEFASPTAEIVAVGVWKVPFVELEIVESKTRDSVKEQFLQMIADVSAEHDGREIDHRFVTGNARQVLVDTDLGADLVVVGARGFDGLQGALIGSVATWVLHHSMCATVIVPSND